MSIAPMNIWNNVRWSIFFSLDSRRRRRRAGAHTSLIEHSWVRRGISLLECENDGETAEEKKIGNNKWNIFS